MILQARILVFYDSESSAFVMHQWWFQRCRITHRSLTANILSFRNTQTKPENSTYWTSKMLLAEPVPLRNDVRLHVSQKEQTLWLTLITKKPHSLPTGFCAKHSGTAEQRASESKRFISAVLRLSQIYNKAILHVMAQAARTLYLLTEERGERLLPWRKE